MMKHNCSICILMFASASEPRQITNITESLPKSNDNSKQRFYLAVERHSSLVLSDISSHNNVIGVNLQLQKHKHFTHSFLTTLPAHTCPVNNYCSNIMTLWYFSCPKI